jgi:hypothetical protein
MLVKQRLGTLQINWIKPFSGPNRPISPSGGGDRKCCASAPGKAGHAWDHLNPELPKFDKLPPQSG